MDRGVVALLDLPSELWTHILDGLIVHDAFMLQTTNKRLNKLCIKKFGSQSPNDDTMTYFAEIGAISCLKYCRDIGIEWDEDTISAASKKGQLEAIKFLNENGCEKDTSACEEAAANTHLECLRYMHENGFPWNENTAEAAATSNNLEILKFLRDNGCPWRSTILNQSARFSFDCLQYALDNLERDQIDANRSALCYSAAIGGNLPALKLLHEAGFPLNGSCTNAASVGSLECLKYAHEHNDEWRYTISEAAQGGHLECIKYALQNGDDALVDQPSWHVNAAVSSGNIECVKLLLEHGAQWRGHEYDTAAMSNRLEMVKYMLEVAGRPASTTNKACMRACGNLQLLKHLHENGFSWDGNDNAWDGDEDEEVAPSRTILYQAIEYQSLPCLKYILDCGYKLDTKDLSLCNAAARKNDVEILKFLIGLGCERHYSIMEVAAKAGALDVIKYLHKSGTDLDEGVATWAASFGHHKVLEYAFKHGYGLNSVVCALAASRGYLRCLKLAHKYGVPFTANTMLKASKTGYNRLACLKYLHENGCEWSHQECTMAVMDRDLDALKYFHEHGCGWGEETWCKAVYNNDVQCLEYLYANGCPIDPQTFGMKNREDCYAFMQKHNLIPSKKGDEEK